MGSQPGGGRHRGCVDLEHVGPNWQLQQTLPVGSGEEFVALREDRLLIGEHRTAGTGVAYLYGFDEETAQWTLNQTLSPADGQAGDLYGIAVSLSGTAAIIGAPRHFHFPNPQSGAAYISKEPLREDGAWHRPFLLENHPGFQTGGALRVIRPPGFCLLIMLLAKNARISRTTSASLSMKQW